MKTPYPKYLAAAVQAAPVYMALDATVEKTCALIEEAAKNGAKLVAFPEAFIPGYPWWIYIGPPSYGQEFLNRLYENAVEIPSPAVARISDCCRKNKIYTCVSVSELDGGSLYLTQLWFNDQGDMIGKHRKLRPTNGERYIWGCGDGTTLGVMPTELGNLGSLQCWEHILPINLAAMTALHEQVHVGAWPGTNDTVEDEWTDLFATKASFNCTRYHAIVSGSYVLSCSMLYTQEMSDMLLTKPGMKPPQKPGGAYTCIYNPQGHVISEIRDPHKEGICYAQIDIAETIAARSVLDSAGHSAAMGVVRLNINREPQPACRITGGTDVAKTGYEELHA